MLLCQHSIILGERDKIERLRFRNVESSSSIRRAFPSLSPVSHSCPHDLHGERAISAPASCRSILVRRRIR